jgi:hypothetical protein
MSSQARSDILNAIKSGSDVPNSAILVLLLGALDDITFKIDAVLADEKGLREAVLNGHSDRHNAHHEWVENKIQQEDEREKANKQSARTIRDSLIIKTIPWAITVFTIGTSVFLFSFMHKYGL